MESFADYSNGRNSTALLTLVPLTPFQLKSIQNSTDKYVHIINTSYSQRKIVRQISRYLAKHLTVLEVLEVHHQSVVTPITYQPPSVTINKQKQNKILFLT